MPANRLIVLDVPWSGVTGVLLSGDYDGSIVAILESLCETADLEGVAVLDLAESDLPVPYSVGFAGRGTVSIGRTLLIANPGATAHAVAPDGRSILTCPWVLPPSRPGGLLLWRAPSIRPWSDGDHSLAASVGMLLNLALSANIGQVGIDRLTGIPNRRWFLDEADRHIERLDVDGTSGTLCVIDIDNLRRLNLTLGRRYGDRVLVRMASQLRAMVRPGDVVARIGADTFAMWQTGVDHMTAAERAERLCSLGLYEDLPDGYRVTFSVGIASRGPGAEEDVRTLLRRAHMAAREIKDLGGGGWRVALAQGVPRGSGVAE
jgi:diguanylate cyclase (GGDEF)-like protein